MSVDAFPVAANELPDGATVPQPLEPLVKAIALPEPSPVNSPCATNVASAIPVNKRPCTVGGYWDGGEPAMTG